MKLFSFDPAHDQKKANSSVSRGLAPVVCYEPWFPRFLEAIKQSINDGHPALIRLHSAASYPTQSSDCYANDLESHAVLVIGYDDEKEEVTVIDPWNNNWGGVLGGRRRIRYSNLSKDTVDSSLGMAMILAPLETRFTPKIDSTKNLSMDLEAGFYVPRGTAMDKDSWSIFRLDVDCILPESWKTNTLSYTFEGNWTVGDSIKASIPILNNLMYDGRIQMRVKASIRGKRPYKFTDQIETQDYVDIVLVRDRQEEYTYNAM